MDPFSPFQGKEISRKSACHFFVFLDLYRCAEFRKRLMNWFQKKLVTDVRAETRMHKFMGPSFPGVQLIQLGKVLHYAEISLCFYDTDAKNIISVLILSVFSFLCRKCFFLNLLSISISMSNWNILSNWIKFQLNLNKTEYFNVKWNIALTFKTNFNLKSKVAFYIKPRVMKNVWSSLWAIKSKHRCSTGKSMLFLCQFWYERV